MFSSKKQTNVDTKTVKNVIEGLKQIYAYKVKPVEELYHFDTYHSPILRESDFDSKPMVLLLGQYSTGKTTFISYLLERSFPGAHIGPEPTTDRFMAIMHGKEERTTPGNALAVQADKPFRGLEMFGTAFLSKFQSSELPAPLLEDLIFIDTPGVLSGEKQRIGRAYDFVKVIEWFAGRCDMILLLFDAYKLDISDEFKRSIEALKGQDDKLRLVLNKADLVNSQQLMRVYGALMWSLGKVIKTPEVIRVYIGSFWNEPYQNKENENLFKAEQQDLLRDLKNLPANATIRKVNELVKRARLAKVHAYIVSYLRNEMPSMFGKQKKQEELLNSLPKVFDAVARTYNLPMGDFPDMHRFKECSDRFDFSKDFPALKPKLLDAMDQVLSKDLPELMQRFPQDKPSKHLNGSEDTPSAPANVSGNGAGGVAGGTSSANISDDTYAMTDAQREKYKQQFFALDADDGFLSGEQARTELMKSGLEKETLKRIWFLSDVDKDGKLDCDEYGIAIHLAKLAIKGTPLPASLPPSLMPSSKMNSPF